LPLERVVEALGDLEELLVPLEHFPSRDDPQFGEQRKEAVEDLGDAAAEPGGIDVSERPAPDSLTEIIERVHPFGGSPPTGGPSSSASCSRP
jgi:hypothetical protein